MNLEKLRREDIERDPWGMIAEVVNKDPGAIADAMQNYTGDSVPREARALLEFIKGYYNKHGNIEILQLAIGELSKRQKLKKIK